MKTKAEMTQEYSMILLEKMDIREPNDSGWMERIAKDAAMLANVVQAEIEKNLDKSRPDVLTKGENGKCLHFHHEFGHKNCMDCGASLKDWQPDWSQAPEWAKYWTIDKGESLWWSCKPCVSGNIWFIHDSVTWQCHVAPSFNYQGNWRDSLRKRPIE